MMNQPTVLQAEVETAMRLLGAGTVAALGPKFVSRTTYLSILRAPFVPLPGLSQFHADIHQVNTRIVERDIYDGEPNLDETGLWEEAAVVKSKL